MSYSFVIQGKPVVQQRARRGKYGQFYDPSSKERKILSGQLLAESRVAGLGFVLTGLISLKVDFYFSRGIRGQKPDLSNLLKALEDSGNGILWQDDQQIQHIEATKYECEKGKEHTVVEISGIYDFPSLVKIQSE